MLRAIRVLLLVAIASICAPISAQEDPSSFPTRPIKLLVGFSTGGSTDTIARQLATGLSKELGQSVVFETRAGAGGMLAAELFVRSPADGYTLMMCNHASYR